MNDQNERAANRPKIIVERTYRASAQEVWDLWTTKDGFESWWGPEGFRVEVHALDARVGGPLQYDMIADAPEQIAAMKAMGQPTRHGTRGTFTEVEPRVALAITHVIDFLPGVAPYDATIRVQIVPTGDRVRMVVELDTMHTEEMTRMQEAGFTSQLTKLDKRFGG